MLSGHSLKAARAAAAAFMTSSAQVKTSTRVSDGAGGYKVTGSSLGTAFPVSFAPLSGEDAEEFMRATGKVGYGLYFPHTQVLNREDVVVIGGVDYDIVFSSCDQSDDDVIQHYARASRR